MPAVWRDVVTSNSYVFTAEKNCIIKREREIKNVVKGNRQSCVVEVNTGLSIQLYDTEVSNVEWS